MSTRPMHSSPEVFQKLQSLYFEANTLIGEENYAKAAELYTEGIGIDDHFRYQYITQYAMRARCYMMLGRHREAIADLEKAIAMEPDFNHADYNFMQGKCYDKLEDYQNSIKSFSMAIALTPNDLEAYYYRGLAYFAVKNKKEALSDIEYVIANDPETDQSSYELRNLLREELGLEPANDEDTDIFPGQPISKLSDYVKFMKKLQTGDMNGALADYKLDMMQYGTIAQQWGTKMATDANLTAKYAQLMTTNNG